MLVVGDATQAALDVIFRTRRVITEKLHDLALNDAPPAMVDMINSRACRTAVMFNDVLDRGQCEELVRMLVECKFPFQCAHGRPSMVPIVNLGDGQPSADAEDGFGPAFADILERNAIE